MAVETAAESPNIAAEPPLAHPPQPVQPADTLSIDPTAAEALLSAAQLGQRIKRLRLKRSMGLVDLGRLTGLSASFLSQLETGRVVPTLRNLARIALVFNKDLSWFFESAAHSVFRIQRSRDRVRLPNGSSDPDYIAESFGILIPEGGLRPCLAEFLPGQDRSGLHPDRHSGVEMVYVLGGSIELRRKGEPYLLEACDVCYISGETPRSYRSAGDEPARALIISFDRDSEPRRTRSTVVS
jgi:transcriptional regulator with XRE-family HTH domain